MRSPVLSLSETTVLPAPVWTAEAARHQRRIAQRTDPIIALHHAGTRHPVYDFLFTYYSHSPAALQRWHPGPGVVLAAHPDDAPAIHPDDAPAAGSAPAADRSTWRHYRWVAPGEHPDAPHGGWTVDLAAFLAERGDGVAFIRDLVARTAARQPRLGCFGLHEWAMAYRSELHGVRHSSVPLRLGAAGTNAVVEAATIQCTHVDAFRFFAPEARELNTEQPTRAGMRSQEQPGCLHATMDLYKWCVKLLPAVTSSLTADCFELAWQVREMDMKASPYDLADWGFEPIRIETPAGRAEYVRAQSEFARRGQALRARLLAEIDGWLTSRPARMDP
ncbi:MAG: 3-methyladenine DNA glycosylase [Micrococcus sp.]|nr:3-methyladenine DNA glycosylase [Micrococcus sp.]